MSLELLSILDDVRAAIAPRAVHMSLVVARPSFRTDAVVKGSIPRTRNARSLPALSRQCPLPDALFLKNTVARLKAGPKSLSLIFEAPQWLAGREAQGQQAKAESTTCALLVLQGLA